MGQDERSGDMAERSDRDGELTLNRSNVRGLDAILGHKLSVLDDGFVRVIDYMGNDAAVVQAARVSYGAGTKRLQEDRGLIRYLMRHSHTTPFEMCEIKLHVRVPMDVWRQWIRHRTASVNEYSTRYSVAIDAAQRIPEEGWRLQSVENRQGSTGYLSKAVGVKLSAAETEFHKRARQLYEDRLTSGVAREQARKDLPLSTYTEAYWKIDLHNLLHFLTLRMDSHAQAEIRSYANAIGERIVARWVPIVWEAFLDYRLNKMSFSAIETRIIRALIAGDSSQARELAVSNGLLLTSHEGKLVPNRERKDLEAKIALLGLSAPWL
jgi:thymidylate synthase (FAD)